MNILTNQQLATRMCAALLAGSVLATGTIALLERWQRNHAPAPIGTPAIVGQTNSQTIARIPTLRAGVRVDCTVTIDQAKNVWSITC